MNKKAFLIIAVFLSVIFVLGGSINAQAVKYPALTSGRLVVQGDAGKWDSCKAHTMSVVEANKDGYKYWGYYGLSYYGGDPGLRRGGLVRSNDLVNWVKYEGNPIIPSDCRWPTVVFYNKVFYMFYAEYNADNDSRIVMLTSKDGIHFDNKQEVVGREAGAQNQNPFIFYNKKDSYFYLTYYHGIERSSEKSKNVWQIMITKAKNINDLKTAARKTLLSAPHTIAAPSIAYYNNKYYLLIESLRDALWDNSNLWETYAYSSDKADGDYKEVSNSLVLKDNDACAFEYVLGGKLYIFYSHCYDIPNSRWDLRMVKALK